MLLDIDYLKNILRRSRIEMLFYITTIINFVFSHNLNTTHFTNMDVSFLIVSYNACIFVLKMALLHFFKTAARNSI